MRETIHSSHLYRKRGVFYFSRRVPADLRQHYKSARIVLSLRTKSAKVAQARATTLAAKLDQDWLTLRWKDGEATFSRFFADPVAIEQSISDAPKLTEAAELYLRAKGANRPKTFHQTVDRAVRELAGRAGDKPKTDAA